MTTTPTKDERISLRVTSAQKLMIESAARAQGRSVSDLAIQATTEYSADVLADRRFFTVPVDQWESFIAALEAPIDDPEVLVNLFRETPTLPARV
jgi:uncharacterized protein (DUF1778 family)